MAFGSLKGTLVGAGTTTTATNNATGSVAVAVGDLIVAVRSERLVNTVTSMSNAGDPAGTWTAINAGTVSGIGCRAFYKVATSAGTLTTVTSAQTASGNHYSITVAVFEGPFLASGALDRAPANTTDAATPFTCAATTVLSQADELIVVGLGLTRGQTTGVTATAPLLLAGTSASGVNVSNSVSTAIGYQAVSATTSVTPVMASTGTINGAVQIVGAFKKDAGATGTLAATEPAGGVGTVAYGSQGTYLSYSVKVNSTLVAPSGVANGDLLIAYLFTGSGSGVPAPIPTPPAGWTTLTGSPINNTDLSNFNGKYHIFWKIASSESGDYTFTHTSATSCGLVIRYTGVDTATPFSPTPTTNKPPDGTGGTSSTALGFTTTVANTFVIFTEQDWGDNATDCTPPTGTTPTFTERVDAVILYIADGTLATAGATGDKVHTNNNASGNPWAAYLIGLKPASTAGGDVASFAGAVGGKFIDLGMLGSGGSRATDQATINVSTTAAVAVGELVVVAITTDNFFFDPIGNDDSVISVTLGPNNFIKAGSCGTQVSASQTCPGSSIWYCTIHSAVALGQNITATFINPATSDHSALSARHFSMFGQAEVAGVASQFMETAADPPSLDVTTPNAEYLRVRMVGNRYPTGSTSSFSQTAGWVPWSVGYSGGPLSSPDWEIFTCVESIIFTGTSKPSDPSGSSGGGTTVKNANVYVAFGIAPPTGQLAATEVGDGVGFSGVVGAAIGTLEAYEGAVWITADSTLYTADDDVTRVNSATIIRDTAAFTAEVVLGVSGTLAATEATDTAAFAGQVRWLATLAATEGADTAAFNGLVARTGVLAATEGTADTAAFAGTVRWNAVLAVTEAADTAAFAGTVRTNVALAAIEAADTASFAGTAAYLPLTGTLAATEFIDTAAFAGFAQASGTLTATENRDTAAFSGGVLVVGALDVTESEDIPDFTGALSSEAQLEATEDSDTADFAGEAAWTGVLAATEDADTAEFSGLLSESGVLAATEGTDTFAASGYLSLIDEKIGELIAHEDRVGGYSEPRADSTLVTVDNTLFHTSIDYYGQDRALFVGDLVVEGVLNAFEEWGIGGPTADSNLITADSTLYTADQDHGGYDVADFGGTSLVDGTFAATEEAGDVADFGGFKTSLATLEAIEGARDTVRFVGGVGFPAIGILGAVEGSDTARFAVARWEEVGEGAGLRNEVQRTVWLAGKGGRVTWLENEVEDISELENLNPEVVFLENEVLRITELRP